MSVFFGGWVLFGLIKVVGLQYKVLMSVIYGGYEILYDVGLYCVLSGEIRVEMFELFEVEMVCCGLVLVFEGVVFIQVDQNCVDFWFLFLQYFMDCLIGQMVMVLLCWLKYLLVDISLGDVLVMYLGMLGLFCVELLDDMVSFGEFFYECGKDFKYDYVVFYLIVVDGSVVCIIYNDLCCFGFMDFIFR